MDPTMCFIIYDVSSLGKKATHVCFGVWFLVLSTKDVEKEGGGEILQHVPQPLQSVVERWLAEMVIRV